MFSIVGICCTALSFCNMAYISWFDSPNLWRKKKKYGSFKGLAWMIIWLPLNVMETQIITSIRHSPAWFFLMLCHQCVNGACVITTMCLLLRCALEFIEGWKAPYKVMSMKKKKKSLHSRLSSYSLIHFLNRLSSFRSQLALDTFSGHALNHNGDFAAHFILQLCWQFLTRIPVASAQLRRTCQARLVIFHSLFASLAAPYFYQKQYLKSHLCTLPISTQIRVFWGGGGGDWHRVFMVDAPPDSQHSVFVWPSFPHGGFGLASK